MAYKLNQPKRTWRNGVCIYNTYQLNSTELYELCFHNTVRVDVMDYDFTQERSSFFCSPVSDPGIKHLSQANKRRTESRGVSVPEQLIRSCSCREVSVRVLCSVFGLQLTVSLGDSRVWSPPKDVTIGYRTDIVQGDVHSHLSSPVSRFQL